MNAIGPILWVGPAGPRGWRIGGVELDRDNPVTERFAVAMLARQVVQDDVAERNAALQAHLARQRAMSSGEPSGSDGTDRRPTSGP